VSDLGAALLDSLSESDLRALAQRLEPYLPHPGSADAGEWLDSRAAAAHLGISRNALHKLTAARQVPFEQEGAGCKVWFRRSELNHWREAGGARSSVSNH
jgi:hypothetical protein